MRDGGVAIPFDSYKEGSGFGELEDKRKEAPKKGRFAKGLLIFLTILSLLGLSSAVSQGSENDDFFASAACFMILPLFFVMFYLLTFIHELGHLLYGKYYCRKGIVLTLVNMINVKKSPLGKVLRAGYRFEGWFILVMFFVFLQNFFFMDVLDRQVFYVIFVFSGMSVLIGIVHVLGSQELGKSWKEEDLRKLAIIQRWIKKGCACGNHTFILGPRKLICEQCEMVVEEFTRPEHIKPITPLHLNPLYLFSRKSNRITYTAYIKHPREEVFRYFLSPPHEMEKEKLKIRSYIRIDENSHKMTIGCIPYTFTLFEKSEPFYISFRVEYLGETDVLNHYIYPHEIGTIVILEQISDMKKSTILIRLGFRKQMKIMKRVLKRS